MPDEDAVLTFIFKPLPPLPPLSFDEEEMNRMPELSIRHPKDGDIMVSEMFEHFSYVRGELIVIGTYFATYEQIEAMAHAHGGEIVGFLELPNTYQIYFANADEAELQRLAGAFTRNEWVSIAALNVAGEMQKGTLMSGLYMTPKDIESEYENPWNKQVYEVTEANVITSLYELMHAIAVLITHGAPDIFLAKGYQPPPNADSTFDIYDPKNLRLRVERDAMTEYLWKFYGLDLHFSIFHSTHHDGIISEDYNGIFLNIREGHYICHNLYACDGPGDCGYCVYTEMYRPIYDKIYVSGDREPNPAAGSFSFDPNRYPVVGAVRLHENQTAMHERLGGDVLIAMYDMSDMSNGPLVIIPLVMQEWQNASWNLFKVTMSKGHYLIAVYMDGREPVIRLLNTNYPKPFQMFDLHEIAEKPEAPRFARRLSRN